MQYLFIVIAVVAIVIFSAQNGLSSLSQFLDFVHNDMLSLILWLGIAILALGMLYFVGWIATKKNGR